jgi:squalene-associated FAD-dependent desaturase
VKVVVVGGGFAGLAAAIALQERRHEVTLLERRGVLGGRATSYRDAVSGDHVDNGTHLMVGAYTDTLDLLRRAGADGLVRAQEDLRIDYVDERGPSTLHCPRLPAPLHLLGGLLGLRLPWRARLGAARLALAARLGRVPEGLTLAEWFLRTGQDAVARRVLWDPLATAILNETPERAAATLFRRVFRDAFLASARASCLVFPRVGWGVIHDRLAAYLAARGGLVRRRALAEAIEVAGGRVTGVRYVQRAEGRDEIRRGVKARAETAPADAVVCAAPWHAVGALLPEEWRAREPFAALAGLRSSPIVSVEMWVDRVVVDREMVGLRDAVVEWVFDKGRLLGRAGAPQHLAFIISAAARDLTRPNAALAADAEAALRRFFPAMRDAAVVRTLVLREADATFACTPEAERLRPGNRTPIAGLALAGDWTDTGLPATIEGAVRSGRAAARVVEAA